MAAVSGREPAAVLEGLLELVAKELVAPVRGSSIEGETEFLFVHALVCDVAYEQLTRADRAAKHAALARWFEERTAGRTEDLAEVLAYHYGTALDMAASCGLFELEDELAEPTTRYLALAGGRAAPLDASAAAAHFARAERVADEAAKPKRRWLLSRRTRRTLRRRAPLLMAAAAVLAVAAVAALAIWAFAPAKTPSTTPKTMTPAQIAAKYGSSVVSITTPPMPPGATGKKKPSRIVGSGFMASKDGWIVTSLAVVQGQGTDSPLTVRVEYALPSGEYRRATGVVFANDSSGIALVKVDPQEVTLAPLPLGDSDSLAAGDRVVGLGAQPDVSVQRTSGAITGTRLMNDATSGNDHVFGLEDDLVFPAGPTSRALAEIGGPLFDETGHVVGVVGPPGAGDGSEWGYAGDISRQAIGIWWAVGEITVAGKSYTPGGTYMGVRVVWLTRADARSLGEHAGAVVEGVTIDSPADRAGIVAGDHYASVEGANGPTFYHLGGDVIVSFDGIRLTKDGQLQSLIRKHKPGDMVALRLWRDSRLMTVKVKLAGKP